MSDRLTVAADAVVPYRAVEIDRDYKLPRHRYAIVDGLVTYMPNPWMHPALVYIGSGDLAEYVTIGRPLCMDGDGI